MLGLENTRLGRRPAVVNRVAALLELLQLEGLLYDDSSSFLRIH